MGEIGTGPRDKCWIVYTVLGASTTGVRRSQEAVVDGAGWLF